MSLFVNVLYTSQQPRQVRIGVTVNQAANVKEIREILASDTGIEENHMLLTEVHDEGFHRYCNLRCCLLFSCFFFLSCFLVIYLSFVIIC